MKTLKFSMINKTKINPPISGLIFRKIKDEILGKEYELSVAFENGTAMRKLNRIYRDKDYATDILSFPISKTEGEIIICEKIANKKSKLHHREPLNFLYFLFIHGLLHLKGMEHSSRMEREEEKFRKKFGI